MQQSHIPEWVTDIKDGSERQFWVKHYTLPNNLRTLLFDENTASIMWEISHVKYDLSDRQVSDISYLTGQVVQGNFSLNSFIPKLAEIIGDKEKAKQIAQDINEQIFQPVREELLQVHGIQENQDANNGKQPANRPGPEPVETKPDFESPVEKPAAEIPQNHGIAQPTENAQEHEESSQKREELLAKLRAAQNAPITQTPPPLLHQNEVPPQVTEPPKPVTAAWNGKTIDLSKIPPRRALNGNGKKNGDEEIRTVQLKKGPDGYWYEI